MRRLGDYVAVMITALFTILSWLVFGFIAGLIARAIYPGPQPMSFLQTAGVGIAGSFVGGLLANLFFGGGFALWHTAGLVGSVLGAMLVLFVIGASRRGGRRASRR